MRPGFQVVVSTLRGCPPRVAGEEDLRQALDVAEQEHVLPMFLLNLQADLQAGTALPDALREQVSSLERDAALAAFWWTSELRSILRGFQQAELEVVLLKGPSLAERLYGGVARRSCRDLDLLVRRRDSRRAEAVLAAVAFVAEARPDDYHGGWKRAATMVELHLDVENPLALDFEIEAAWTRVRKAQFAGEPCLLLSPMDEVLFLCLHGVRHRFEKLSLLLDVALAFERLAPQVGAEEFGSPAALRLQTVLLLGFWMGCQLKPELVRPAGLDLDGPASAAMETLAAKLWRELAEASPAPLDWRRQHLFYLELQTTMLGRALARLRLGRILATRLIEEDFVFASRFGVTHKAAVWLLRPLRLLRVLAGGRKPDGHSALR